MSGETAMSFSIFLVATMTRIILGPTQNTAQLKNPSGARVIQLNGICLSPDFPSGAPSMLFERWRRIFGHFFRSSLKVARYLRLIHVKTAAKSASTFVSNPNEILG